MIGESEVINMANKEKKLLKKAWEETKKLEKGEVFLVKDLFKGYKWNRLSPEMKMSLGRSFLEKVSKKKSVEAIEKSSSNLQQYKISDLE